MTWNPRITSSYMADIEGLREARRIGIDEVSRSFARAAGRLAPDAQVVPADELMARVRRIKFPEELDRIRAACAVAWFASTPHWPPTTPWARPLRRWRGPAPRSSHRLPGVTADGDGLVVDIDVVVVGCEGGVDGRFVDGERGSAPALIDTCRAGATSSWSPEWC